MSKPFLCHDFKSPRTDMSRRLPGTMKVVPLLFYGVLFISAYFGVRDVLDLKAAEREKQSSIAAKAETDATKAKVEEDRKVIETDQFRGEAIAKWVEGTRSLQPATVGISRSVPPEVSINELTFERSAELPAQVSLTLRMTNGGPSELSKIEEVLRRLRYRSHSPQQQHQGDLLEYHSMLVWQDQ
jgi:hypothetical protein